MCARAVAPERVPRAQVLAGELAFDPRPPERARSSRRRTRRGRRTATAPVGEPKSVMMPASSWSLSCQSRLVTWNGMRERSPHAVVPWKRRRSVRSVANRLGVELDRVRVEAVGQLAGDRQVRRQRQRRERPPLVAAWPASAARAAASDAVIVATPAGGVTATCALAAVLGEAAERPLEQVAPGRARRRSGGRGSLLEVGERREIDVRCTTASNARRAAARLRRAA